ncbi:MAG: MFS transporter [Chloroflexota bacterium]
MEEHARAARKITRLLFIAQSLGSAGFIAAFTVNAIVGADLSGQAALAGLPGAIYVFGGAFASLAWGYAMDSIGRRGGLVLGLAIGVVGAAIAGGAVLGRSFPFFLAGLALMGVANAALQLGRFAAAEVHPPSQRGRAISNVVLGGTAGAVLGPLMVGPTGQWALQAGLSELAGPYSVGFALFAVAAVVLFVGLRPDPRDLGLEIARLHPEPALHAGPARSISGLLREPGVVVAMGSMVFAQLVMTMVMVITSLHMTAHAHPLAAISVVISSHTIGMFAFSVLSGRLSDRWGRGPVILVGTGTLLVSCLAAPWSTDLVPLAAALFLLGLGWNFSYVGGSTLLSDQLSPSERAKTQGFNDLLLGLASATGSLGSGVVFASAGFGVMATVGAVVSLIPLALALWWQFGERRLAVSRKPR